MAYNNNIPQPNDAISVSQGDILNNFAAISTFVNVNHVDFNGADQGKHKWVTMPVQGAAPATGGGEIALFSRTSTLTSVPEMAFRRDTNGAVIEFTSSAPTAIGWTRLPSGILLKWGNSSANGLTTYTFPAGATIPAFTNIFSIQITTAYVNATDNPNGFVRLNNFVAPYTTFSVFGSPRTTSGSLAVTYQYLAIGV